MFSVIIPLHNKAPYIQRAIDSVLNQSFTDFEIIVVNDGSGDGGEKLVQKEYGGQVTLLNQKNLGVSVARNTGIEKANYTWIAFLDADDYWHPKYLMTMANGIRQFPNAGIWGSSYGFDEFQVSAGKGDFFLVQDYFNVAIYNTYFFTSAVIINKKFFEENEGFKTFLKQGEDLDVWFRVIGSYGAGAFCKDRLVWYEKGDSGSASKSDIPLDNALVGCIGKDEYITKVTFNSYGIANQFNRFKIKLVLFKLFPFFQNPVNKVSLNLVLEEIGYKYLLVSIFYRLPASFLQWYFSSKSRQVIFRNYMKFCFRYIY